ncbi:MAG: DUF262 domain-containing protein [Methanosarcinales archaeon]|nr:MAG: DUF262 domain-containing protein [Methanosarcinales archaeon]
MVVCTLLNGIKMNLDDKYDENDDDELFEKIQEDEDEEKTDDSIEFKIISYGADYTLKVLYDKLNGNKIITPSFQRGYVWNPKRASKLIESFLLGLPVPQIFLYKEEDSQELIIVDGKQRLETIKFYFDGKFPSGSNFYLRSVKDKWLKKKFVDLDEADKIKLEDAILRATIFQQTDPKDNSSIFEIFERLNTGGVKLMDQEIRNCIVDEKVNKFLKKLNDYDNWRVLFGIQKPHNRMKDVEMILRFFTLFKNFETYTPLMKIQLTEFMKSMEKYSDEQFQEFEKLFQDTIDYIYRNLGENAFRVKTGINIAVFDAITVAIARLSLKEIPDITKKYNKLISNENFLDYISVHTTDTDRVKGRIEMAIKVFST